MALLINNYCVVIKIGAIERIYPPGIFLLIAPLNNVYSDGKLLSVSFSSFHNANRFFKRILKDGLTSDDVVLLSDKSINDTKPAWLKNSRFLIEENNCIVNIVLSDEEESTDTIVAPMNWNCNHPL